MSQSYVFYTSTIKSIQVNFENKYIKENNKNLSISLIVQNPIMPNLSLSIQTEDLSYRSLMDVIRTSNDLTNKSINKTNSEIDKMLKIINENKKSVDKLEKRVQHHDDIFEKQFKIIERQMANMIQNRFKKFNYLNIQN